MTEYLPVFYEYGIDRQKLLQLKHWEVNAIINGYYQQRARNLLALTDAITLGAGMFEDGESRRKLADNLLKQAGFDKKLKKKQQREDPYSWAKDLAAFAKGF